MKIAVICVTLPVYFQHFKNMSKDNNERHYGFKHIQPEYSWMTPGWIEELVKHEPDEEVRNYVSEILTDLTAPEKSRLESPTDNLDCIENYWINRLLAKSTKFEDDAVYQWMVISQALLPMNVIVKNSPNTECSTFSKAAIRII